MHNFQLAPIESNKVLLKKYNSLQFINKLLFVNKTVINLKNLRIKTKTKLKNT